MSKKGMKRAHVSFDIEVEEDIEPEVLSSDIRELVEMAFEFDAHAPVPQYGIKVVDDEVSVKEYA